MLSKTKIAAAFLSVGIFAGGLTSSVAAQDKKEDKKETITVSKKEESAIKKIEKAKTIDEKMQLTADFIKEFPQSQARKQVVNYALGQISEIKDDAQVVRYGEKYLTIFTQPEETDLIFPSLVFSYTQLKRPKEAFETGEKYFARHPEDVSSRLVLAIDGANRLRSGEKDYAVAARDYAVKAIELIEADKRPADITEARWAEYKTKWLPQLYQSVGIIDYSSGDKTKARTSFEKSVALDAKDVNSWLLIGTLLDDEYQAVALKFNAAAAGAERDALLKQANEKMDATIDVFARVVALTDGKPEVKNINDQIRSSLESYYQYRHKNTDGMQALIDKYKK